MKTEQFYKKIKGGTVLVDFTAAWCRPCRAMEPILKKVRRGYKGKVMVLDIDIDSQKILATNLMVQSIPTLIIFKNGREIKRLVGIQAKSIIEQSLDQSL